MAAVSLKFLTFTNGKKQEDSKNIELMLKQVVLTDAGNDVGAIMSTDANGNFSFNNKLLKSTAVPEADADLTNKFYIDNGLASKIPLTQKGQNNGVATLDAGGKIPADQLPSSVMDYKGNWDASTNTPTLADGTGNSGDVYRANAAGTVDFGAGDITFAIGDWAVYNGTIWEKSNNSNSVMSVNNQVGVVVLDTDNIDEGSVNLYYTAARFNSAFGAKSTSDLTEGSNLYFTNTRFDDRLATKSTSDLTEGSNLYYTTTRFDDRLATKTSDDLAEGSTNKYFTEAAAIAALTEETLLNSEGAEVTVRQFGIRVAGAFVLAKGQDAALDDNKVVFCVKDATIADNASGKFYKHGAKIPGFTGLTVDGPVYLSRSVDGGYVQTLTGFVAGEKVVKLGTALSATVVDFAPEYLYEIVS